MIANLRYKNENTMDELARLQKKNRSLQQQLNIIKFFTGLPHDSSFVLMVMYLSEIVRLILMKLILNIQHQDLTYRFSVSQTVVSDILTQGQSPRARKLCFLVQWPHRETVNRNLPDVFREIYKRCRIIIDRGIARMRIHVERAIGRIICCIKLLTYTMNLRMVPHSNNIMTICAALSNLHKKLVNKSPEL
ncbi:hypothetical protein ACJMK2_026284 [Sinanodonta woodiana]|uniref:DDE Tnp4 domain-containing protein n=1 Tax=Sinanodonta woodiana TaxID=1069815 RepID=A0ABD3XJ53_SINWO